MKKPEREHLVRIDARNNYSFRHSLNFSGQQSLLNRQQRLLNGQQCVLNPQQSLLNWQQLRLVSSQERVLKHFLRLRISRLWQFQVAIPA